MGREDREVIGGLATYGIPATTTHKVNLGKKGKSLKPLQTMNRIAFENKHNFIEHALHENLATSNSLFSPGMTRNKCFNPTL